MKKLTARSLVRQYLGVEHLSQQRVDTAVDMAQGEQWVLGFHPISTEPDRTVIAVRKHDPFALPLGLTFAASCPPHLKVAKMGKDLLEKVTESSITDPIFGHRLAQRGLLIANMVGDKLDIMGTNPDLAKWVNETRYFVPERGRLSLVLAQAALGMAYRPQSINSEKRQEAAQTYEELDIDALDILAGRKWGRLRSGWLMEEIVGAEQGGR